MLRWLFFATWVGILVTLLGSLWTLIRINLKMDRDNANNELLRELLSRLPGDAVKRALRPQEEEPPTAMGLDFGLGLIWWRLKPLLFGKG